ncbi:TonB-dependent receptor [Lutibacter sp.]|uniref:TonB-dependent receptor n=1 Tax=Lutibacter sp. TaxID=1925666 RepID=UPI002734436C|nr:TonB-dependent receptor [Lutibacter sp.]MDP3312807.1 TonB-dependent receptor [Lutibacter sp.]
MKKYLTILFVGLSICVTAQNKLSGTITNSQNQLLQGVEVYIEELQKGTTTNEMGKFELINLPKQVKLSFSFMGFETQIIHFNFIEKYSDLSIILKESIFNMDEVIISTPFNKLQSENVMKVDRVSIQQLQNNGATTLIEGISSIPGVSQVSTGSGIGKPVIRGLRGNRVLVYTQGIRLENQQYGDEHGLGVDDNSVESIEVIKGPASLLYGSDALGGILYFNPLRFADDNSFNLNINQGYQSNTLGHETAVGIKQSYNKWKFLVNGAHNSHSDYQIPSKDRITNTRFTETIFNAGAGYSSNFIASTLRFNYNTTKVGIPEEVEIQSSSKTPLFPYQDLNNKLASLNTLIFLPNSKIATIFGYTVNDRKEFEEHQDEDENEHLEEFIEPAMQLKLNTFSYDIKWYAPKFKKIETIVGIQGLNQKNTNYGEEILIPNATTNDFGVFTTGTLSWNNNSFLAGLRLDSRAIKSEAHVIIHNDEEEVFEAIDKSYTNFTSSLGLKTLLFKSITTRLNLASGFRAPNLAELTSNGIHHGTNRYEIGNNTLKSEQNVQYDVALEYNSDHLELFANGFYNQIDNYIFISPTGELEDGANVYEFIQDNAKLYGGEFGLHLHPHPFDWLHLYSSFEFVIGKQNNGNYLPLIPAHKLTNMLKSEFNYKNWLKNGFASLTLESHLDQTKISEFETSTNNYNIVSIGTGGTIKLRDVKFDISLNINNLLNKEYVSHLSRLKMEGIQNMGRNFMASLKLNI